MSPLQLAREIETAIGGIVSRVDVDALPLEQRKMVAELRGLATDARLDARDYDYAETRAEQQALVRESHQRLEQLQKRIVAASSQQLFSAVDVAHLSAQIQQLIAKLQ
jgi:hypothetical protein